MRSYIFTRRERQAIEAFMMGKLNVTDHFLSQIRTRMRQFSRLEEDIILYTKFRQMLAKSM